MQKAPTSIAAQAKETARALMAFIDKSPTPYHVVQTAGQRLVAQGFHRLVERDSWKLTPGQKCFVERGGSIAAFVVGSEPPAKGGLRIVGAHTDSPCLRLKPKAPYAKNGYCQLGVEVYGGALLSTWMDRDLSVAGRVFVRDGDGVRSILVDLGVPLFRTCNLAIHLNREVNKDGLKINAQQHLPPIWALEAGAGATEDALFSKLRSAMQMPNADVIDYDLSLYDTQRAAFLGLDDAFISSARLDNLVSAHVAIEALVARADATNRATRIVALFDHEEVGSKSRTGAQGSFLVDAVCRIVNALMPSEPDALARAMASSLFVSADMAHAVHPNYADKHDPHHMPVIGRGPVLKVNANQSYATDGESAAMFRLLCDAADVVPQHFVSRTDLGCGSTIGPISAALLGVKVVDVGNPMLAMHSCRELGGTADVEALLGVLTQHFGLLKKPKKQAKNKRSSEKRR